MKHHQLQQQGYSTYSLFSSGSAFGSPVCTQEEELAALAAVKAPGRRKMPPKGVPAPAAATQPTPTHVMTMNYAVFRQALGMLAALRQPDEDAPVAFRTLVENCVQPYLLSPKFPYDPCAPRPSSLSSLLSSRFTFAANTGRILRVRVRTYVGSGGVGRVSTGGLSHPDTPRIRIDFGFELQQRAGPHSGAGGDECVG